MALNESDRTTLECDGLWIPSASAIAAAERELTTQLTRHSPEFARKLPSYYRQYLGIVRGGRRRIYINAMHDDFLAEDPDLDPTRALIFVDDGGDRFFQAEYDVAARRIAEFGVNGEA